MRKIIMPRQKTIAARKKLFVTIDLSRNHFLGIWKRFCGLKNLILFLGYPKFQGLKT